MRDERVHLADEAERAPSGDDGGAAARVKEWPGPGLELEIDVEAAEQSLEQRLDGEEVGLRALAAPGPRRQRAAEHDTERVVLVGAG